MIPNIFEYTNYRTFIKDFYTFKKSENSSFSYQFFSLKAGFKSKASLANVTSGVQTLAKDRIYDVARAMNIGKKETMFFESLVCFNDSKTSEQRQHYFDQMQHLSSKPTTKRLHDSQYEYYSKWYHCAIREIIAFVDFCDDFTMLANLVDPPIKPAQAKKSIELLTNLKLIQKSEDGRYEQTDKTLSSDNEVVSFALQKYHKEHLALASDSIDRHDRTIRNITSVTAGLSKNGFDQIKKEITQFREKLLDIIDADSGIESVYQIAFQLFPISKTPKNWRK